jgi:hypothetical protein
MKANNSGCQGNKNLRTLVCKRKVSPSEFAIMSGTPEKNLSKGRREEITNMQPTLLVLPLLVEQNTEQVQE